MIKNAKTLPRVFYGLHMAPGIAEYKDSKVNEGRPYRIFIDEPTIKNMDQTYTGRPVYVRHKDEVDLENLHLEADGYVVESFYNRTDGKHWAKFIVVSDKGHEAIQNGWKLSNAYVPKKFSVGGQWHGVDYSKEVVEGEYDHLAIVPNPRYAESVILTPEQFKSYNNEKELELKKLSNSKDKEKRERSMFNLFKKTAVENAADYESTSVVLPKSKVEMTIAQVINMVDEMEVAMSADQPMVDLEQYVELDGVKLKVKDLIAKIAELKAVIEKKPESDQPVADASPKVEAAAEAAVEKKEDAAKADAAQDDKEIEAEKKTTNSHFEKVANAEKNAIQNSNKIELSSDMVTRGKARYGSN